MKMLLEAWPTANSISWNLRHCTTYFMNLHEIVPGNFFTFAVRKMTSLHSMRAGAPNLNFGHHYVNHGAKIILSTFSYYACSCKHDHLPKMVASNNTSKRFPLGRFHFQMKDQVFLVLARVVYHLRLHFSMYWFL